MSSMQPYSLENDTSSDIATVPGAFPDLFEETRMFESLKSICSVPDVTFPELQANLANQEAKIRCIDIAKAQDGDTPQATNQDMEYVYSYIGLPHPVDYLRAKALKDVSAHHSSCIAAKLMSAVGLGFVDQGADKKKQEKETLDAAGNPEAVAAQINSLLTNESYVQSKVDEIIDPMTMHGFSRELSRWVEDYLDCGSAYLEIVRNEGGKIVGVNWLPVEDLYVYQVRDEKTMRSWIFYTYIGKNHMVGYQRFYAPFGKANKEKVIELFYQGDTTKAANVSEIIPLYRFSNRSKHYGYPEWLSAAPVIDLIRRAMQYKSDWFTNRGVLDYIFALAGQMGQAEWDKAVTYVKGTQGGGSNHKGLMMKMSAESKTTMHHMAGNNEKENAFAKDLDTFSQFVVSAHRVPPVMANILIPGKLGASNEMIQALMSFQLLNAGPTQRNIQATLARTLAHPTDGIPGLKPEDFRLNTITSQFDIVGMDTAAKSRSEAVDNSTGPKRDRDFSEGVEE